ncbi:MAG: HDOD domain-containing protein [Candidatus Krumholzibacteriia bacterium]
MPSADVFAQIEKMGELPSLPQTLLRIQKVASDDRSSADDLAACILQDQSLTMRVLRVVNSALYRRSDDAEIRTVHKAVIRIGFDTVRNLALGLSVFDMMSKLSRSPSLVGIARHSLVTAGLAQLLAEASGKVATEEAFVTALIHDIGKVVLLECSPAQMEAVARAGAAGEAGLAAERRGFGITHDRAGRRLARRWQLPTDLQNLIGDHHDIDPDHPPRDLDPALAVLVYANALAHCDASAEGRERTAALLGRAARVLGIPSLRAEKLHARAADLVRDLAKVIGLDLGDLGRYGCLVNAEGSAAVAPRGMDAADLARRTARQLELYQAVGRGLAEAADPQTLLQAILDGAAEILGFERVLLLLLDRSERRLRARHWAGPGADRLAAALDLPLERGTGAVALAVLEQRPFHVPMAASPAYQGMAGQALLALAACAGFAVAPVRTPAGIVAVLYGDGGAGGADVEAEQASELAGLATQTGLVLAAMGAAVPAA